MDEDAKKEVIDLLDNIENKEETKKEEIQIKNVMVELKQNLANYLNSLITSAIGEDDLLGKVKQFLLDKVPELDFSQLMSLYKTLDQKKTVTNNQLTTLLKPTQQAASPLLDAFADVRKDEEDEYAKTFNGMESEELRKIDKLDKVLGTLEKLADKAKENEESNTKD